MDQNAEKLEQAQKIVKNHVLIALGAGLVPLPILDIAAVTAVQLDMLKQLARHFEVPYYESSGKGMVSALTGSTLARIGASVIKAIPGVGTVLGGVSMSIMSGASTYAVGQVFLDHFAAGGGFHDFDPLKKKDKYQEELEKGKRVAKEWKQEKEEEGEPEDDDMRLYEKLAKLGELKEKGVLSEEEFKRMKAELLGEL